MARKDRDTGGSRGAMAPSKIFSNFYSITLPFCYLSLSEYTIVILYDIQCAYLYDIQYLSLLV